MKITEQFTYETVKGFKFGSWPFGRPGLFAHVYFLDGLLIDTGHSNMRKEVLQTIDQLPVEQIFITHHHEDHNGNLAQLQELYNCPSYASEQCVQIMKNPPAISFAQWLTWGKTAANFKLLPTNPIIETENYEFEVIAAPGHARDMVCLFEKNRGWLFSADLFVSEYIRVFMRGESMKEQIESIKKILNLDFEVLFCSHNPQFKNGKQKLKNKLSFFESFYQNAANLYRSGKPAKIILKEMKLKEKWALRILSTGELSTLNMIKAVIKDEKRIKANTMA